MTWGEGRAETGTTQWLALCKQIKRRDRHTCRTCGARATDVDHIIPKHLGGTNHPDNLQALCRDCHKTKTAHEGAAAAQRAREHGPQRARPTEQHPGLIS